MLCFGEFVIGFVFLHCFITSFKFDSKHNMFEAKDIQGANQSNIAL